MGDRQERKIMQLVQERMPDIRISLIRVEKNNGSIKQGFQIFGKGKTSGFTVYQENLEAECGNSFTAEKAADYICRTVERESGVVIDPEEVRNWETAKYKVHKKVVNYERNSSRLPAVVHRRYLDLAEVYYLNIPVSGKGWGTGEIPVRMLEEWGIPEEELAVRAEAGMEADGYCVQPIQEFLSDVFPSEGLLPADSPDMGMYLILNRRSEYGAGVLSSRKLMKKLMEQIGEDCYILPSSVHELLALPCSQKFSVKELQELVRSVNRDAVSLEDFLSDSVYFCHMDTGEVELCSDR